MNNATIKQLRAFVTVVDSGNFAEACVLLHLSQPALSIAIKNLEQGIGGKLLIRSTKTSVLTPEGREFYPTAKLLLNDWDNAFNDLNDLFSLKRGKLELAAMPSFGNSLLPSYIRLFRDKHPNINIKVHDVIAEDTIAMVRAGRVELAVTFDPGDCDDLTFYPLFSDNFIVALPEYHPLLTCKYISWQAIAQYPFIALQKPSSIRELIDKTITANNIQLNVEFEANQLATIGKMISEQLGISIMPSLCKPQLQSQGVMCRPLKSPLVSRRVGIVKKRRIPLSSTAQALVNIIKAHSKNLIDENLT
ncbi:LysR family transcriptional regulator [Candidatus Colwellia aromaticivorans]|uniref:LysR family transcriptional regulator n=1 Tax=Candidatus Colwellia aromaticivorans TaxID=2267621 RepID=UPI000DF19ECD|nr:LysR family transcriptional regulator [Candidatus Colwellia aromaticivorans]